MFNNFKDAYDKYIIMDNRFSELEKKLELLAEKIEENSHTGRICPACNKKTLYFPNKEYKVLSYANQKTGKKIYSTTKRLIAVCQSCNWEYDDQEFIKNCLNHL